MILCVNKLFSQSIQNEIKLDFDGAVKMMNVIDAISKLENNEKIDSLLNTAFKSEAYVISEERFGAEDQAVPVTLEDFRKFIKSFTPDSVNYVSNNKRLIFLKPYFQDAVDNPKKYHALIDKIKSITQDEINITLKKALDWSLPDTKIDVTILISFDIGGAAWAYKSENGKNYIMYSVPFLPDESGNFNKDFFLYTIAHEIHHIGFPIDTVLSLYNYEQLKDTSRLKLYTDFIAGMIKEGMAQKFCSNAPNKFSSKPYINEIFASTPKGIENWDYFISDFENIHDSAQVFLKQIVNGQITNPEKFYKRYDNYWTWRAGNIENKEFVFGRRYYYGAELLGVVNMALSKEPLYKIMKDYRKLPYYYNIAIKKLRPNDYENYIFEDEIVNAILHLQ